MDIIDVHTHIFPDEVVKDRARFFEGEPAFESIYHLEASKMVTAREMIRAMDQYGVAKSVILGFPWHRQDNIERHNDAVLEAQARYPDRFMGLGIVNPANRDAPVKAADLLSGGMWGLGELAFYLTDFDEPLRDDLVRLAEVCAEHDKPLLLHTNEPVGYKYPGKQPMTLAALYALLKAAPRTKWILAHWGGGLPFFGLMKSEVDQVLENVWFDTSASPFLYRPQIYEIACRIVGKDKILFGSDYPLIPPPRYFGEMESAGLDADVMARILADNARNLFSLSNNV